MKKIFLELFYFLFFVSVISCVRADPRVSSPDGRLKVDRNILRQGEVFQVTWTSKKFKNPEAYKFVLRTPSIAASFHGDTIYLFAGKLGVYSAFIAVPATLSPGNYELRRAKESISIKVLDGGFPIDEIKIKPSKERKVSSPAIQREIRLIRGALKIRSMNIYSKGAFQTPVDREITSLFGGKRRVNGRISSYHRGVDIGGPIGTPIHALNAGRVVLAENFGEKSLNGSSVAIDHGQGIVSYYGHLDKIFVKKGQLVKKGQEIATMGNTGRTTAPNLHFGIYAQSVPFNPEFWIKGMKRRASLRYFSK